MNTFYELQSNPVLWTPAQDRHLIMNTQLIQTLSMAPSVSLLMGFDGVQYLICSDFYFKFCLSVLFLYFYVHIVFCFIFLLYLRFCDNKHCLTVYIGPNQPVSNSCRQCWSFWVPCILSFLDPVRFH